MTALATIAPIAPRLPRRLDRPAWSASTSRLGRARRRCAAIGQACRRRARHAVRAERLRAHRAGRHRDGALASTSRSARASTPASPRSSPRSSTPTGPDARRGARRPTPSSTTTSPSARQGTGGSTAIANPRSSCARPAPRRAPCWSRPRPRNGACRPAEITVESGRIRQPHPASESGFGELAESAAKRCSRPATSDAEGPEDFKLIGKPTSAPRHAGQDDGRRSSRSTSSCPDMLTVRGRAPAAFGAKVEVFDDRAARAVPGVVDVKAVPQGVAVYAESIWAANKGRDALEGRVGQSTAETRGIARASSREYRETAERARQSASRNDGDVEKALGRGGARRSRPSTCSPTSRTRRWSRSTRCCVRPTTAASRSGAARSCQTIDQAVAAGVAGLDAGAGARSTRMLAGGSFGRRAQPAADIAAEAAAVAQGHRRQRRSSTCGRARTTSAAATTGRSTCTG